ncbi:Kv channel-interacting protein 2-like protein, partial [Dinothrombium tinctorium]
DCPNGYVDVDVLRDVLMRFFPYGNAFPYAYHVFRTLDPKKKGEISFKEFLIWLSEMSRGTIETKLKWIFQLYDINGDGFITKKELSIIINSIYTLLGKKSNAVDDKYIEEKTRKFFHRFDINSDGYISHNEFIAICRK